MPGLIPHIRLGHPSELGKAVSELTGLAALVDLARHAERVKTRIEKDLIPARQQRIGELEVRFARERDDLVAQVAAAPSIPPTEVHLQAADPTLEHLLQALTLHFGECQATALTAARDILGAGFDVSDDAARRDLMDNIGPALAELRRIGKLTSAARLRALGTLKEEDLLEAETHIATLRGNATILADLRAAAPPIVRRKQLYARVVAWIHEDARAGEAAPDECPVCGADLANAIDYVTGIQVKRHLAEALATNAELVGQTIRAWVEAAIGALSRNLPAPLNHEINLDLPAQPRDLIRAALCEELFDAPTFAGSLSPLRRTAADLCGEHLSLLADLDEPPTHPFPSVIAAEAEQLNVSITRCERAIAFSRWRLKYHEQVVAAFSAIVGAEQDRTNRMTPEPQRLTSGTLWDLLLTLQRAVEGAAPIRVAKDLCARMVTTVAERRREEARIAAYDVTLRALPPIIRLKTLVEYQVDGLRALLQGKTIAWRDKIYRKTQTSSPDLVDATVTSKGELELSVGSNGASAPAQHVANVSALRAGLMGFFFAFWEHVLETRGGLSLLLLDDPQDLLDQENRHRLAEAMPQLADCGAQLLVTSHDHDFARQVALAVRRKRPGEVEHRSVFPVSDVSPTLRTPLAVDDLETKRQAFLHNEHRDQPSVAQDYLMEIRIFIEARLAEFLGESLSSGISLQPTLATLLARLRSKVKSRASDFFRYSVVKAFAQHPALNDGSRCLTLLNRAHHKDKKTISFMDAFEVRDDLACLTRDILNVNEEYRRWRQREPSPAMTHAPVSLIAMVPPPFEVEIFSDLAAFTRDSSAAQASAGAERLAGRWFDGKALYYIDCHNFGFAAPRGSVAVVDLDGQEVQDRRLVIAIHGDEVLARRLLRPQDDSDGFIALGAETPDPRKSPPSRLLPMASLQLHRVVGILFEDLPPRRVNCEAVQISDAPSLRRIEAAFTVRDDSALPLALPGQVILGGQSLTPSELAAREGDLVAVALDDDTSILKRISKPLPGALSHVIQLESIGGLGASILAIFEPVEGRNNDFPQILTARLVLGVLYQS
jgi:energy-coupling factor transporter ATP-binding protein EcfA2